MLSRYGWSPELQAQFDPYAAHGLVPGRVTVQQRGLYTLVTELGELTAELAGRFAHEADQGGYPVAGDWVAVAARPREGTATIHDVLPRRTAFIRKAAGATLAEQVVAANIDTAFVVTSLNVEPNPRRLERYLATAWGSGAQPAIVLTKTDVCADVEGAVVEVEAGGFGVPLHPVSAVTGEGLDELRAYLGPGRTVVLLGSSGVGKSTLVNALAGAELLATQEIRADGRGRHTTSHRELVLLPGGGLVLDTPGMRELGLWDADAGVAETFEDVEKIAAACRFSDCGHETEPGCAIRTALEDGSLAHERYQSYVKLELELAHLERKGDPRARAEERKKWIARSKAIRTTSW